MPSPLSFFSLSVSTNHTRNRTLRLTATFFLAAFVLLQQLVVVVPGQTNSRRVLKDSLVSDGVVISQVYGGGGNSGATFTQDFVELFNRGSVAVSLNGWSIQYASATGTGNFGNNATAITELPNVTLQPGQYFLILGASGSNGVPLPVAGDLVDSTPINLSGTAGKIVLANVAVSLGCNGGSAPCSPTQLSQIVDLVGFGNANFFEGAGAVPTLSNSTAAFRNGGGCVETDNNNTDFAVATPSPRNTASSLNPCTPTTTNPSGVGSANPELVLPGEFTLLTVNVTPGTNPTSTGIAATADLTSIGGSPTQTLFDDGTNGDVTPFDNIFSYQATVDVGTPIGDTIIPVAISDAQSRTGSASISLSVTSSSIPPSGVGSASPSTVEAGSATQLTVNVTPGSNPVSTGLAVSGDLTSIGGSGTQQFFDDGSNGDVNPGDNVFTYNATVSSGTTAGGKNLSISISDAQSRTGNANISLTVTSPPEPAQPLPFIQNWTNTGLITADNDWSGVPGIIGYRGDGLAGATAVDPQTILQDGSATPVNVLANQTNPSSLTSGGITEFELANPAVAFQGSGTARAPHFVISINTVGASNITVSYDLRDLDGGGDNSVQPVALQYRIGTSGNFTNVPAAFVADASSGPNEATLVTPVGVLMPSAIDNQPLVQLRIITADAIGSDEWIGIDDIWIESNGTLPMSVSGSASPTTVDAGSTTLLTATVGPGTNPMSTGIAVTGDLSAIDGSSAQQFFDDGTNGDATPADRIFSYIATIPVTQSGGSRTIPVSVVDDQSRTAATSISLTVRAAPDPQVHITMGNPSGAVADINFPNNYLMLKNQYAMSYNRDRGTPNWVAWQLDTSWLGSAPRQDDFRPDDTLPVGWYRVTEFDYSGSGFDRGHHTPSGDRTATIPDNSATFLMTNMMPQAPDNNQGPWESLESFSRTLVNQGNELYIYMGGTSIGGSGSGGGITTTIAGGNVTVPGYTWKVIMILPSGDNDVSRVDENTRMIAVILPNRQGLRTDPWQKYIATVDQVEALTGYDFYSNVSPAIQTVIESRLDAASNTAPETIAAGTFTNLAIDAPNTTLTGDVTVNGVLTLGGSTLRTGTNNRIILGPNSSVTRISGYVEGSFEKQFDSTGTFQYPVGTENGYSPVDVNVNSVVGTSSLTVSATQGVHPNAPTPLASLNRYWTLTENGDITADLTFNYLNADVPSGVRDEATFELQRYEGTFQAIPTTVNTTANTLSASNISEFSDWTAFGDLAPTAATVSVSGRVLDSRGNSISSVRVSLTDANGRVWSDRTNNFGFFNISGIPSGLTYTASAVHKEFTFVPVAVNVQDDITGLNFVSKQ